MFDSLVDGLIAMVLYLDSVPSPVLSNEINGMESLLHHAQSMLGIKDAMWLFLQRGLPLTSRGNCWTSFALVIAKRSEGGEILLLSRRASDPHAVELDRWGRMS